MKSQNCVFCEKSLEESNTVKLYQKDEILSIKQSRKEAIELK